MLVSIIKAFSRLTLLSIQFECIQKLPGHSGEIWALAVSKRANFVVTGSHDKSIRIWEKTDEPVSVEARAQTAFLLMPQR